MSLRRLGPRLTDGRQWVKLCGVWYLGHMAGSNFFYRCSCVTSEVAGVSGHRPSLWARLRWWWSGWEDGYLISAFLDMTHPDRYRGRT